MSHRSPARGFRTPLFPYEPAFVPVRAAGQRAEMAYVDVGPRDADPVLLLHGNPTWSFLYREVIPELGPSARAVAPDLLGFGRSDKLDRAEDYTLETHVEALTGWVEALDLHRVTLVVHDWGGPIGLSWAVDHPERVARLVVMNTWAFAPKAHNRVPQPLRTFRTPGAGELLVLGLNGFVNAVLPLGVVRRRRLRGDVMQAYRAPFPDWPSRAPILAFPRDIPTGPEDRSFGRMQRTEEGLARLERPALLVWGMRDPVFPPRVMKKFRERLPSLVEEVHYDDASHFLQEDKGPDIGRAIRRFVTETSP